MTDGDRICGACGHLLQPGARFCPSCGAPLAPLPPPWNKPDMSQSRIVMFVLGGVAAVLLVVLVFLLRGGDDSDDAAESTDPSISSVVPTAAPATTVAPTAAPTTTPQVQATVPPTTAIPGAGAGEAGVVEMTAEEISAVEPFDFVPFVVPGKAVCATFAATSGGGVWYGCEPLPEPDALAQQCEVAAQLGAALQQRIGPITYIGLSRRLAAATAPNPPRDLRIVGPAPQLASGTELQVPGGPVVPLASWASIVSGGFEAGSLSASVEAYPFDSSLTALEAACGVSMPADPLYEGLEVASADTSEASFAALLGDPMYASLPLQLDDSGDGVRLLQQALTEIRNESGDDTLSVGASGADGRFGQDTQQAVISLQMGDGLPPTGIVDDATLYWLRFRQDCYSCLRD